MQQIGRASLRSRAWQVSAAVAGVIFLAACGGGSVARVTSITITTTTPSIPVGGTAAFTAVITDQQGNPVTTGITLTSSMPAVAMANTSIGTAIGTSTGTAGGNNGGSVAGLLPGTTQITATVLDITSNSVTVTVTPGFLPAGSLTQARGNATATVLNNGKVLIAGGASGNAALADAEIYDPASGTFTATGSLNQARYSHFAALLYNGNVLIGGGFDGANFLSSAEIYNPATGAFTPTGTMVTARRIPPRAC